LDNAGRGSELIGRYFEELIEEKRICPILPSLLYKNCTLKNIGDINMA
jgi:hypothetical protein